MAPLALLSLLYSRKKKRGKLDAFIILLVLGIALSLSLTSCGQVTVTAMPTAGTPAPTYIIQVTASGTTSTYIATPNGTPIPPPTLPNCPTPRNWSGSVVFTRYVTVEEGDDYFKKNDPQENNVVPIEIPEGAPAQLMQVPVKRFYVGNADDPGWSVYESGSGALDPKNPDSVKLSGGQKYAQTDLGQKPSGFHGSYYFTNQLTTACGNPLDANANIIAVAQNLFGTEGHGCGDTYYFNIPELENTIFTVEDSGSFPVQNGAGDHFDIYVGIQDHKSFGDSPLAKYDGLPVEIAKAQP
jgi:hypothetical protein